MTYRTITAPVRGGDLVAGIWEPEVEPAATVLAVHGITASHRAWPLLADALPEARIVAPDLRGRGGSRHLPGPWGLRAHADDLAVLLDTAGVERATLVGHSMGGFVTVEFARAHADRVAGIVLVDGGLPLPPIEVPEGEDPTVRLLGPAAERLRLTFPDREAYRAFWRAHPAFATAWTPAVEQYVDYDLIGTAPDLHSASLLEAVVTDSMQLDGAGGYLAALQALAAPVPFIRAPRGLLDQPGGLYPADAVDHWAREVPGLVVTEVPDVNHYTILFTERGVRAVASAVREVLDRQSPTKAKEPK